MKTTKSRSIPLPTFTISKRNPRRVCFADLAAGEHVLLLEDIELSSQMIKESKDPDNEPDDIGYFVASRREDIRVDAGVWYDLQSLLME